MTELKKAGSATYLNQSNQHLGTDLEYTDYLLQVTSTLQFMMYMFSFLKFDQRLCGTVCEVILNFCVGTFCIYGITDVIYMYKTDYY